MPTSISTFPIQQEYPRNLPAAAFPNGDDVLLLDGATSGTRGLSAGIITQLAASQLPANMPVYDGMQGRTTSNTGLTTTTDPIWAAGKFTQRTGASDFGVFASGNWLTAGTLALQIGNNQLRAVLWGSGSSTRVMSFDFSAADGTLHSYVLNLTRSGYPSLAVDGVTLAGIETTSGSTPPAWTDAVSIAVIDAGSDAGNDWYVGAMSLDFGTGTWSASDISIHATTGALPGWVQTIDPAGISLITGDNSTFASDTGFWSLSGGATISGGYATIPNGGWIRRTFLTRKENRRYRIAGTVTISGGSGALQFGNDTQPVVDLATTSGNFSLVVADGSTAGNFTIKYTGTGQAALTDLTITPLGLIAGMDPTHDGTGYQWPDVSGARRDFTMPISDWEPINAPSGARVYSLFAETSTAGNQQILGQHALPANAKIISWDINSAGTPTVSRGNASGATTYGSGDVLTAGQNALATTAPFTTTQDLWVNSSTVDLLKHAIRYVIAY